MAYGLKACSCHPLKLSMVGGGGGVTNNPLCLGVTNKPLCETVLYVNVQYLTYTHTPTNVDIEWDIQGGFQDE